MEYQTETVRIKPVINIFARPRPQAEIISWGAGVNSTAIIALHILGVLPGRPEIVFADTGAEKPRTYKYIKEVKRFLHRIKWDITVISPRTHPALYDKTVKGRSLIKFCREQKVIPHPVWRWCSSKWKIRPLRRYAAGRPFMLGMCADEKKRMYPGPHTYPLKDYTREQCRDIVLTAGLPEPHKTGCYICPMQTKASWFDTRDNYPVLWKTCKNLEAAASINFYKGVTIAEKLSRWEAVT